MSDFDLSRLVHEHEDLAEAVRAIMDPVEQMVLGMHWNGPHHDRLRTELRQMTKTASILADELVERGRVLHALTLKISVPGTSIELPPQLIPLAPRVAEVLGRYLATGLK